MINLAVIVAVSDNGVLGRDNGLPWHLPADLKYFKQVTLGKPIVMGRKTFESIGRPLPGRTNIVVSTSKDFVPEGVEVVASLEQALTLANSIADAGGQEELMVIGGATLYAQAIPLADRLYITEVHASVRGDVSMPPVDWVLWKELSRVRHTAVGSHTCDYSFVVYERDNGVTAN